MTGTEQLVALMCVLATVLVITFLIMAPSILSASKKNRES
jgi:hypothetical protein